MTSTITAHKFAQMQHAAYEAQAARHASSTSSVKERKTNLFVRIITALGSQIRKSVVPPASEQLATNS